MNWILASLTAAWLLALPINVWATEWTEDINAGIEQAAAQDKDLLLLYTGSDWCPPCKKLEEEVLSQKEFLGEIDQYYVLIKIDFPQQKEQSDAVKERNATWAQRFGIENYPTIVLTDISLKPYAFLGYEDGGFQNYLGLLEENRQLRVTRDAKLQAAKAVEGTERAKLLNESIAGMREELARVYYADVIEEIIKLDPEDDLGLRTKWNGQAESELRKMMLADMLLVSRIEKPKQAIAFIDEVLESAEFPDDQRFEALQIKLSLTRQLEDPAAVDGLLQQMLAIEGLTDDSRQRLVVKRLYLLAGGGQKQQAYDSLTSSLAQFPKSPWLLLAKGNLLVSDKKFRPAIEAFDAALGPAQSQPDLLVDIVSAKADAHFALKDEATALQTLDNFAEDTRLPAELRAEALLHKAMLMRDAGRLRQARLAENRAIELTATAQQRGETQQIVDQLRSRLDVN